MGDEDKIEPIEEPTPVLRVEHVPGLISLSKEDLEAFDEKMESQSTTLRGSFADTNFSNRPPLARSSNGRTLSELFAESRPETPFGPSSPPWIDNERFSSTSLPSYATNTPMVCYTTSQHGSRSTCSYRRNERGWMSISFQTHFLCQMDAILTHLGRAGTTFIHFTLRDTDGKSCVADYYTEKHRSTRPFNTKLWLCGPRLGQGRFH